MNVVKYRAWDRQDALMVEVKSLTQGANGIASGSICRPKKPGQSYSTGFGPDSRCILIQYTGLNDKFGVEIYDGDIIGYAPQYNITPSPVELREGGFMHEQVDWRETMESARGIGGAWVNLKVDVENCEVIGNIYENPELLK